MNRRSRLAAALLCASAIGRTVMAASHPQLRKRFDDLGMQQSHAAVD
ncbi:hypothetical protein ACFPPF_04890 [Xenophilus aerolatus]|nr:hypothetical protein [Xenophilus aerolatus]